jgi:hypothetical protein
MVWNMLFENASEQEKHPFDEQLLHNKTFLLR